MSAIAGGPIERIAGAASACRAVTPVNREGDRHPSHQFKDDADILFVGSPLRTAAARHAVDHQIEMLRQAEGGGGLPQCSAGLREVAHRTLELRRSLAQDDEPAFESPPADERAPFGHRWAAPRTK